MSLYVPLCYNSRADCPLLQCVRTTSAILRFAWSMLPYACLCMSLCVITVELTVLYCRVYVLQVPYYDLPGVSYLVHVFVCEMSPCSITVFTCQVVQAKGVSKQDPLFADRWESAVD